MTFIESPIFPDYLAYGLVVGPQFATDVIEVKSGRETTNRRWEQARRIWDGSTTHRTHAERNEISGFFAAVAIGRANAFRVRDVTDYTDDGAGVLTSVTSSPANTYQLGKTYVSGAYTHTRSIYKPRSPIVVTGGGSYSVDYTTGIVTHTAGPAPTGWTGEYDVPVRFDHDSLMWEIAAKNGGNYLYVAREMRLIEVRI